MIRIGVNLEKKELERTVVASSRETSVSGIRKGWYPVRHGYIYIHQTERLEPAYRLIPRVRGEVFLQEKIYQLGECINEST